MFGAGGVGGSKHHWHQFAKKPQATTCELAEGAFVSMKPALFGRTAFGRSPAMAFAFTEN
jgi:hypothetical protein